MSVFVVIAQESDAAALTGWGRVFAEALEEELVVLFFSAAVEGVEPEEVALGQADVAGPSLEGAIGGALDGVVLEEVRVLRCSVRHRLHAVLAQVRGRGAELMLLSKPHTRTGSASKLARTLFERAPCDVLLLRLGQGEAQLCDRVLVPAAGGEHSRQALKLGRKLAQLRGGVLTPLFVEPDIGSTAEEVAALQLDRVLRAAKVEVEEGVEPKAVVADNVFEGIRRVAEAEEAAYDLMLVGAAQSGNIRRILFGTIPDRLVRGEEGMTIGILRRRKPRLNRVQEKLGGWLQLRVPQLQREERVKLFDHLQEHARWSFDFVALLCLSTAIASLGLVLDSTAVVIGAMLVAPLMTPLIGAGLALVQGNGALLRDALKAIVWGFVAALGIGLVVGLCGELLGMGASLPKEVMSRGEVRPGDVLVALLSGVAAAYCLGRPNLSSALPGVAIAAALVPPIASAGICWALGAWETGSKAALLFGINVVAIVVGAGISLWMVATRGESRMKGSWGRWVWVALVVLMVVLLVLV